MGMKPVRIFMWVVVLLLILAGAYGYFVPRTSIVVPTSLTPDRVVLSIGDTGRVGDIFITFLDLVEDNRCPLDVMCIQAGSVTAHVSLSRGDKTESLNLPQDQVPHEFAGYQISILSAEPPNKQGIEIAKADYRVTFRVVPFTRIAYTCDTGRTMVATYAGEEVHLILKYFSLGERQFYLSRVTDITEEKYTNGDVTLGFLKGSRTAFITEQGGKTTFANCLEKN